MTLLKISKEFISTEMNSTSIDVDININKKKKPQKLIMTAFARRHPEFYLYNATFLIFLIIIVSSWISEIKRCWPYHIVEKYYDDLALKFLVVCEYDVFKSLNHIENCTEFFKKYCEGIYISIKHI